VFRNIAKIRNVVGIKHSLEVDIPIETVGLRWTVIRMVVNTLDADGLQIRDNKIDCMLLWMHFWILSQHQWTDAD